MNPSKLIAELQNSARLGKTFPVGWVGGWVRKAGNKAKAQHNWGWNFAEVVNNNNNHNNNNNFLRL